ncbi:MAG TPA: glycosyltransferase [Actinospica sp.]|nr:glycosyltransferase [Actinospica sp.]
MTVSAIVVTWNSAGVLEGLLGSLRSGFDGIAEWRLTIADNDSADETVAIAERWLRRHAGEVPGRVLRTGRNGGYAAAINAALALDDPRADDARARDADGRQVDATLILNPDVRLGPGCVRRMLHVLEADGQPPSGIVVPRIRDARGRIYRSLRREPSLTRALGEAVLGRRAACVGRLGETVGDEAAYQATTTADWATGAVMLIGAACRAACGAWDESFFLYSEETDYALRARDRGFATRLAPAAEATHLGGESKTSGRLWALLTVNRVRLYRRRHAWPMAVLFWMAVLLREAPRAALGRSPSRSAVAALLRLRPVARAAAATAPPSVVEFTRRAYPQVPLDPGPADGG